MGKSEVVRQLRPALKALSFAYKDNLFVRIPSEAARLPVGVSVTKRTGSPAYRIAPSILLQNPVAAGKQLELLLMGKLRPNGIYLHDNQESWWPEIAIPEAIDCLGKFAPPWFEKYGTARYMAELLEIVIRDKTHPINVIEPVPESSYPSWIREWLPGPAGADRRVGPMYFYQSSVLHYLCGNREHAILRTRDWLDGLSPLDQKDRARAQAQLAALTREN